MKLNLAGANEADMTYILSGDICFSKLSIIRLRDVDKQILPHLGQAWLVEPTGCRLHLYLCLHPDNSSCHFWVPPLSYYCECNNQEPLETLSLNLAQTSRLKATDFGSQGHCDHFITSLELIYLNSLEFSS